MSDTLSGIVKDLVESTSSIRERLSSIERSYEEHLIDSTRALEKQAEMTVELVQLEAKLRALEAHLEDHMAEGEKQAENRREWKWWALGILAAVITAIITGLLTFGH